MSRKIAYGGIFAALALLMGYVEAMIPLPLPAGVKLGLSNVVVVLCLYTLGGRAAFGISLVRVVLAALLFKGFLSFWYSCAGALLSFAVMVLAKRSGHFSIRGVSMLGGVSHNVGQMVVAVLFLGRAVVLTLSPLLLVSGLLAGFGIGLVSERCIRYVQQRKG
ncbi:MAG TPA: Gx transporter family protein [Firmicutes bacterium]|nr:Gx transporter family protein [Bacillota bacterium]